MGGEGRDCGRGGPTSLSEKALAGRVSQQGVGCAGRFRASATGSHRVKRRRQRCRGGVAKRVYVCQFWKKWRACHQVKSSRVKIEQNRVKLESRLQSGRTMVLMATATAANPLGQTSWSNPLVKPPYKTPLKTFYKPFSNLLQTSIKPSKIVVNAQGGGSGKDTRCIYLWPSHLPPVTGGRTLLISPAQLYSKLYSRL